MLIQKVSPYKVKVNRLGTVIHYEVWERVLFFFYKDTWKFYKTSERAHVEVRRLLQARIEKRKARTQVKFLNKYFNYFK
jgi:hypothetical protein